MSGHCVAGAHQDCPDSLIDSGGCSCPCHLQTTPQPGDVVRLDGAYCGAKAGDPATIDGSHFEIDFEEGRGPMVLAIFRASAYRDVANDIVSVSGGPCPFVAIADLVHVGTTEGHFWRWKDGRSGGGRGEPFTMTVNLWSWAGPHHS